MTDDTHTPDTTATTASRTAPAYHLCATCRHRLAYHRSLITDTVLYSGHCRVAGCACVQGVDSGREHDEADRPGVRLAALPALPRRGASLVVSIETLRGWLTALMAAVDHARPANDDTTIVSVRARDLDTVCLALVWRLENEAAARIVQRQSPQQAIVALIEDVARLKDAVATLQLQRDGERD